MTAAKALFYLMGVQLGVEDSSDVNDIMTALK